MKKYIFILILLFIPFQIFAQWGKLNDLKRGLILYMPMDENVLDKSGKGNHGTNYGATLRTEIDSCKFPYGNYHGAYSFDGNDSINLGNSIIDTIKDLSVSVWINNKVATTVQPIISDYVNYTGWFIAASLVNGIYCQVTVNLTNYKITRMGSANSLNVWYHIIIIFYSNGSQPKLFVNLIQYTSTIIVGTVTTFPQNSEFNTLIGNWGDLSVPFTGIIDELYMWEGRDISLEPQFMKNLNQHKYGVSFPFNVIEPNAKFGLLKGLR